MGGREGGIRDTVRAREGGSKRAQSSGRVSIEPTGFASNLVRTGRSEGRRAREGGVGEERAAESEVHRRRACRRLGQELQLSRPRTDSNALAHGRGGRVEAHVPGRYQESNLRLKCVVDRPRGWGDAQALDSGGEGSNLDGDGDEEVRPAARVLGPADVVHLGEGGSGSEHSL